MKQLVKVTEQDGQQLVDARELWKYLEVKSDFNNWFKNYVNDFGFIEDQDFTVLVNNYKNSKGGRPSKDYALQLSMAKELAMLQRSDKGKQARLYFIEMEKIAKDKTPKNFPAALRALADKVEELERVELEKKEIRIILDSESEWSSIKRMESAYLMDFLWTPLKQYSKKHGYDIKKVFDQNYGKVNSYHKEVWEAVYGVNSKFNPQLNLPI